MKNYDSKITLLCPVCKSSKFGDNGSTFICDNCKGSFTREQLEKANENRINKQIKDVYEKQIFPDLAKKFKSDMQKAFKGNPYIKIK
jgi:uncharacterized Zn finger protein (UPF0148 family)